MQLAEVKTSDINLELPGGFDPAQLGFSNEAVDTQSHWETVRSLFVGSRASKRSLLIVFRQLSLLVETGIDLAESLELVAASCKHERLQASLLEVFEDISSGSSLNAAVRRQEKILGPEVTASIRAGEATGQLVVVLRQIADRLEEELDVQSQIRGALAYPAILCTASIAVGATLIWFVLPQFEKSFLSMGVEPPLLTEFLLTGAKTIRENLVLLVLGVVSVVGLMIAAIAHPSARVLKNNLCFNSPIVGNAIRHLETGRLFVNLGHLLSNGVSLVEALNLVRRGTSYGAIKRLTTMWEQDVIEGKGLSNSLQDVQFLPEGADAMLIMAERTGKLDAVLLTAGKYYQDEGGGKLKTLLKMSEPLIIILLGVFVGTVVASVLLPILDVQSSVSA